MSGQASPAANDATSIRPVNEVFEFVGDGGNCRARRPDVIDSNRISGGDRLHRDRGASILIRVRRERVIARFGRERPVDELARLCASAHRATLLKQARPRGVTKEASRGGA